MSCKMTTLAEVRLMPRPPARVDNRNTNMSGSVLNSSISTILQDKEIILDNSCDLFYGKLVKLNTKHCFHLPSFKKGVCYNMKFIKLIESFKNHVIILAMFVGMLDTATTSKA